MPLKAFVANNPAPFGLLSAFAGHVAFGFEKDNGKFVIGSMEPTVLSPIAPCNQVKLDTSIEYTWPEVKAYLSANGYTSFKEFIVDDSYP